MRKSGGSLCGISNVFQNTQQYTVTPPYPFSPYTFGGSGIITIVSTTFNSLLNLTAPSNNMSVGNRFYNCHYGVNTSNTYKINCNYATFRSTQSNTNTAFGPGNTGLVLSTNRFEYSITDNNIANIAAPLSVLVAPANYSFASGSGYGIYSKQLTIQNNYIGAQITPTTAIVDQYVNLAINLSSPVGSTFAVGSNYCQIITNKLDRVWRGIYITSLSKSNNSIFTSSNTISMVDGAVSSPYQFGVGDFNNTGGIVFQNTVTATNYTGSSVYTFGYYGDSNNSPTVTCNSFSNTLEGFCFSGTNNTACWKGNTMFNHQYGLVLSNYAAMGTQGSTLNPIDNQWNGSWIPSYGTVVDASSWGSLSMLWIKVGYPWTPLYNIGLTGQNYNTSGNLNITTGSYACTSGGPPPPGNMMVNNSFLNTNQNVFTSSTPSNVTVDMKYISDFEKYRGIKENNRYASLNTFDQNYYNMLQNASVGKFNQIEDDLYHGNLATAANLNAAVSTTNAIEQNYKTFYNLYSKYYTANFSSSDANSLSNLCKLCPGTNGPVIHQARALKNAIDKQVFIYNDNCNDVHTSARGTNTTSTKEAAITTKNWSVDLFPNPNSGNFSIVSKTEKENLQVNIYDISGKLVFSANVLTENFVSLLEPRLDNGIYLVTIKNSQNETTTKKVVVSK